MTVVHLDKFIKLVNDSTFNGLKLKEFPCLCMVQHTLTNDSWSCKTLFIYCLFVI